MAVIDTITKPSTSETPFAWAAYGTKAGEEMAWQEDLPPSFLTLFFTLDYLAIAEAQWLVRHGVKKLSAERRSAFSNAFKIGFARAIISRTATASFNVGIGAKRVRLLPSLDTPTWTIAYLDAGLDQQSISGVLDPFEAIKSLQARDWPAQPRRNEEEN